LGHFGPFKIHLDHFWLTLGPNGRKKVSQLSSTTLSQLSNDPATCYLLLLLLLLLQQALEGHGQRSCPRRTAPEGCYDDQSEARRLLRTRTGSWVHERCSQSARFDVQIVRRDANQKLPTDAPPGEKQIKAHLSCRLRDSELVRVNSRTTLKGLQLSPTCLPQVFKNSPTTH